MCAESKVFNPQNNREEWVEIVKNNNHFWDCEHQQCAAAWRIGCGAPEPAPPPEVKTPAPVERPTWMPERPTNWMNR
jgi:hypothetical protein